MAATVAAIDLGTNTARLLIGGLDPQGRIVQLQLQRRIIRLGGGFSREAGLSNEAMARALKVLFAFAAEISRHRVTRVRAVATSAVRDAANGKAFIAKVHDATGISLEIIGGEEEGLLTLRGVLAGLDDTAGNILLFDIGGGSTEYTLAADEMPLFTKSLPLGVVRLTEGKITLPAMVEKIGRELDVLKAELTASGLINRLDDATLLGTAGTVTTLAAISLKMTDYDYRKVNNYTLALAEIMEIFALLLPMTPAERLQVPGLELGREDLIIAGILTTIKTMELFGFSRLKVSDFGLLEGLLLQLCKID
jgi:exopolyphosphatase/guanosine-5'-triphosphate,3'-diphosphate pyrophosphatase